jgi:hypothetical protein
MKLHAAVKFFLIGGIISTVAMPLASTDAEASRIRLRWNGASNAGEKSEATPPGTAASQAPRLINGTATSASAPEATPVATSSTPSDTAALEAAPAGVVCIAGCYHQSR